MKYIHRELEQIVKRYLRAFPVVGITGPRQSGKSTLLQKNFPEYTYVSFDELKVRDFFANDPEGFMQQYSNKVIFDEVQKAPEMFNFIKVAVDNDRDNYGKFIITGSSQFLLLQRVTESLAGRIGLLSLLPMQMSEVPSKLQKASIYRGGYPELIRRAYADSEKWYSSYLDTYLSKDLRDIKNIGDLRDFRRFISLLAADVSQVLNMSNYARDLGVSVPTIKAWISILEASYIIFLLPPFYKNYGKRITKSPKIYFYDTGLVAALTAIDSEQHFLHGPLTGQIFENYIVTEVLKRETHCKTEAQLYYYRANNDVEVDLIVDRKHSRELIEVKFTATFKTKMLNAMRLIQEPGDKLYLLYNGAEFPYGNDIKVINYRDYLIAAIGNATDGS